MLSTFSIRTLKIRLVQLMHKKLRHTYQIPQKTIALSCLLIGAALVSLFSLGFAKLADLGLYWNARWTAQYPVAVWFILPTGLAILAWFTAKYTPYVAGSGIPQVIASLALAPGANKNRLLRFGQTLWKIPLTFLAMLLGASVGREGPSVQVGAAVMLAWGNFCRRHNFAFRELSANELMAAGAGGGLAAAFNAPLAGVIFAIEELGRGVLLRWERRVLLGVLASGFLLVALEGNNSYFPQYQGAYEGSHLFLWVILCGLICGVCGGIFARLLAKGAAGISPPKIRALIRRHPIHTAFILGLILAALGTYSHGQTYGTGYAEVAKALNGEALEPNTLGITKLFATVASYWSGIAGGIFTPSLTVGAGIGAQLAVFAAEGVDPRMLVLLCMAAFLAGATQSPLTAAVIVMEMTGSQPFLIWSLISCIVATFVSRQFNPKPFYHLAAARFRQRVQEENRQ
ncbi:H+/Cl- antiporter ClcA [Mesocricetibacter intestinalis]|uniref:H+/Cl-antiporter ClcA n=1 Tax=Mesocricetibacter intestinalis TaxID=1521930 RepID=A0A4R6V6S7_9PAST|nr:chloride channel protein [Mesocricetibacter intestinalis]TDQ56528.1 H+/Cl- antiporter ClcA [Mesocricetibacter intestinalis]